MDAHLNPRRDPASDRDLQWRDMQDRDYGYVGLTFLVVAALFIGLLVYSVWDGTNPPDTQVGQNIERSTTPDTPRNPNTPN